MRNEGYIEPVLNLHTGEHWFKAGNMCRFEIKVEWVCNVILKAFLKGLYGCKTAENDVVGLVGYQVKQILSSERGMSHLYANKY